MRLYELFDQNTFIIKEEGGVGRVVKGVNTTPDVGPNEIKRQAKKWGFKVSKDGIPPKIKSNGQIDEELVSTMEDMARR